MEVVKTFFDLNKAMGTNSIAQCSFQQKNTTFHPGHVACIEACKKVAEKTLITFWPFDEVSTYLFDTSGISKTWDETTAVKFCEDNGVDIVFIPTLIEIQNTLFTGATKVAINTVVNTEMSAKSYSPYSGTYMQMVIACEYYRVQNTTFSKNVSVFSIKDGYKAFERKNYCETELGHTCILVDIVYRSDGLPESSSYDDYSVDDLTVLANIYHYINSITYEDYIKLNDLTDLEKEINSIDTRTKDPLQLAQTRLWKEGILGPNRILFEASIQIPSLAKSEILVVVKEAI